MRAGRIHHFGPPNAIVIDEVPCPTPEEASWLYGSLLPRVKANNLRQARLQVCPKAYG